MDQDEPKIYQETIKGLNSEKWFEAMRSEMEFMYTSQVWTLINLCEGIKPIKCKWVFKRKLTLTVMYKPLRGDWWQKVSNKFIV